ncbi:hypothetical protein ACRALDRAFT_2039341 [Sodiomyces alcalophilus JCM 7366]|uniref:uncharacterized protein n=1 Tax=Sodiomyces alcalophilus JCM 7366 TaxID=591952 RepID=UPI0039B4E0B8
MEWFGRARVGLTHAPTPIALKGKDGEKTDLRSICEEVIPPCQLNPFLFNGHVQTFWTATKQHGPPVYYKRKIFDADSDDFHGTFAVDFATDPFEEADDTLPPRTVYFNQEELESLGSEDTRPQLVVLHGLSGGSHEIYLRHAIAPLVADRAWDVCVVNSRGCAKSAFTSGVLYNARATWDIRQVVKWLHKKFPNRPLFGLGFSLGANMLTNYCGEEGEDCLLKAAVVCSTPFNLEAACKSLKRTFLGNEVYQRVMGTSMKQLVLGHKDSLSKYTQLNFNRIENVTYLYEFDREVQCPTWGYPTEDAYYRDASSCDALVGIRIPFLALNSEDDPIVPKETIPYDEFKRNPYTILCTTSLGGHLCWFELGGSRWHSKSVPNFLNYMAFEVDLDSINPKDESVPGLWKESRFDPVKRKMHTVRTTA